MIRLRSLFVALVALVGLGLVGPAVAQGVYKPGTQVQKVLQVDGKRLALPAGNWVVGADGDSGWTDPTLGTFGYLRSVVLFRIADGKLDAVLEVNSNALPTIDGWGMAAACGRQDLVLAVVRYRAGWDGSCYFVTHTLMNQEPTLVLRQARDFAARSGWTVPKVMLTAGFRSANRTDVLDVRYHFAGETRGMAPDTATRWRDSAWMANRLDEDPRRNAFARAVSDWAVGYTAIVDAGLKNRIPDDEAIAMPDPGTRTPAADIIARRMAELGLLRQAGAITEEEYGVQAQSLKEHGVGSSSTAPDLAVVTAVKALSYRIIVSISHIFVDYYWTGNYVAAGALEVLQITINSAKFYMHELGWAKYKGVPRTDAARTIDFRYIGANV